MFIRKLKINGIRGIKKSQEYDFTPTSETKFKENVESFGLERNIDQFNALKQIGIIGLNSSGKTSLLMSFYAGLELWSNSMLMGPRIPLIKNAFSEADAIKFEAEIVMPIENETSNALVGKYNISYTYLNGLFSEEKMIYTEASKTSIKKPVIIYERTGTRVNVFGGKTIDMGNMTSSLFFILRTGTYLNDGWMECVKTYDIFSKFKIYSEQLIKQDLRIEQITLPRLGKDKELLMSLLKIYDPNLVDIGVGRDNIPFVRMKSGDDLRSVRADTKHNILSSGTMAILKSNQAIFQAILTKNIVLFDELGKSAHEGLFRMMIEVFKKTNAQLIFTTHSDKIFEQALRRDQLFSVSNYDGEITLKRISDIEDLDPRYITPKKVNQSLGNNPSSDATIELLEAVDGMVLNG